MLVAELSGGTHLLVNVKEELAGRAKLAIEFKDRCLGVWRVVENAVGDDQVEDAIREGQIHEIGTNHRAIGQVGRLVENDIGRSRDIGRNDAALAVFGDEFRVESGARARFEYKL